MPENGALKILFAWEAVRDLQESLGPSGPKTPKKSEMCLPEASRVSDEISLKHKCDNVQNYCLLAGWFTNSPLEKGMVAIPFSIFNLWLVAAVSG